MPRDRREFRRESDGQEQATVEVSRPGYHDGVFTLQIQPSQLFRCYSTQCALLWPLLKFDRAERID